VPSITNSHIHIDYGNQFRVASYAIDTGERLAGNLDRKYDKQVKAWITSYRDPLFEAWTTMQAGHKPEDTILAELKSSTFRKPMVVSG
jgi:Domain of unknown function (DUF4160)